MINPNPNELRRGNYILYLGELYVVTGLKEEGAERRIRVYFSTLDGKLENAKTLNWIQAIPLTPEILLEFGFVKSESDFHGVMDMYVLTIPVTGANENEISFYFPKNETTPFGRYSVNGYHGSNNFECVHQMQNAYQSLTFEELKLKTDSYFSHFHIG